MKLKQNKRRFFCPVWKYPLDWSRKAAGTKTRMIFMMSSQIFLAICFIFFFIRRIDIEGQYWLLSLFAVMIILFYTIFPICYIYVIYRLLQIIDHKDMEINNKD